MTLQEAINARHSVRAYIDILRCADDALYCGWTTNPEARLTSRLAREILRRRKVPFYCSAWSNIRSARNAIRSGFVPAWVEMTVKPTRLVDEMNQTEEKKTTFETAEKSRRSRYNED